MARPLRVEFEGALYRVTSRGNARHNIFLDDADREIFLATLAETVGRRGWICHPYCLMSNHYYRFRAQILSLDILPLSPREAILLIAE